jgi:thymidylate synthase
MLVNRARTVSEALHNGLHAIRVNGIAKPSRVGDVLVMPKPVMTEYEDPTNRVLFSPMRDANPFFHVMEALWMLAGHNDLPWLTRFNKRFSAYSDDGGQTQPGAYGYRWRNYFGHDQLMDVILELKTNPDSRRVVLTMWDGGSRESWLSPKFEDNADDGQANPIPMNQPGDFYAAISGSADVPCNTHAYFDTIDGRLNMTVCCRSNDIIWGAYGANAVHFSFLLEFISAATGIPMGVYRQFSNNFHLYTNIVPREQLMPMARDVDTSDKYLMYDSPRSLTKALRNPPLRKVPLMQTDLENFERNLGAFMAEDREFIFDEPFFDGVAIPMYGAHKHYRQKRYDDAIDVAYMIKSEDWRFACVEWLQCRQIKHEQNQHRFTEVAISEAPEAAPAVEEENVFGVEERSDNA